MPLRLALLVLLAFALLPFGRAAAERRVALVIGNAAYQNVGTLDNPVNDARDMAAKLTVLGFDVIRVENGTKQQLEQAVGQFSAKLGGDAVSLFYYAGHGLQVNGHNYLVPIDAHIESEPTVRLVTLDLDAVLDQMSAARSRVNLVILDACRNNPFEKRFRSVSGGLASIDAPSGTLIAYATAPGKVAADGEGRNALYTSSLLRALDEPGMKVEDVFKHVRVAVSDASKGAQTPWELSSLTGDFYFRPTAPAVAAPAPAPAPAPAGGDRSIERAFWESIKDSTDRADFADYLKQYPSGAFRSLAQRRLAALQPAKPQPAPPPAPAPARTTAPTAPQAATPAPAVAPAPARAPAAAPVPTPSSPAPPAPPPEPSREAMAAPPGGVLAGKYVARDKGACGATVTLTIAGRHVTGAVSLTPRDVAVDGDLEDDNRFKFTATGGDRNYPYLVRLEGKFPDLVLSGSTFCTKVPMRFTRQE